MLTFFFGRESAEYGFSRLFGRKPVVFKAVYQHTVFTVGKFGLPARATDDLIYRQVVFLGESVIPRVVRGYAHNCARTVRIQDVVGGVYRHFFIVYRVYRIRADKYARLLSCRR